MNTITYKSDRWKSAAWRRGTRYYYCQLQQDLFGNWIVCKSWGDVRSKRGREMIVNCACYDDAVQIFSAVEKRRKYRKYVMI